MVEQPLLNARQAWMLAIRPKTLPAGAVPVVLGSALAAADGQFRLLPALVALICALGIQVATNFINEIYDFRKGADTADRLGPTRTVAAGIISEKTMIKVSALLAGGVFFLGLYLVYTAGWPIFIIGVLSLLFAWAYTGGPYPIAYSGLGDLFVFIFFGLVAVGGTYYVQAHDLDFPVLLAAVAPGSFSVNILLVNNIRDITTDRKVGKMTLPARIGGEWARRLYIALTVLAYLVPCLALAESLLALGSAFTALSSSCFQDDQGALCKRGEGAEPCSGRHRKADDLHGLLFSAGLLIPIFQ